MVATKSFANFGGEQVVVSNCAAFDQRFELEDAMSVCGTFDGSKRERIGFGGCRCRTSACSSGGGGVDGTNGLLLLLASTEGWNGGIGWEFA